MIGFRIKPDTRRLIRNLARLPRDMADLNATEINRQMKGSIAGTGGSKILPVVGMARRMADAWGIKPRRRIRKRMFIPRGALANRAKLRADGLILFEELPRRYFDGGKLPSGAVEKPTQTDSVGRTPFGGAFPATLRSGASGNMVKMRPQTWGRGGKRNAEPKGYLPINWATYVDVSSSAYQIRQRVLNDMARAWPRQMDIQYRKYLKRRFRA